jgi:hypothetical protein
MRSWALLAFIALGSCADTSGLSDAKQPLASDQNAEIAARDCGIDDWEWAQVLAVHGPSPEEPHFGYKLESLPSEEIMAERGERSWDRTKRIEAINACLYASFEKQKVRFALAAPALVMTLPDETL